MAIIFVAIQLEILEDMAAFDEIADLTIVVAGFMAWYGLRACYHDKPNPIELAVLVNVHMLCGACQHLDRKGHFTSGDATALT